jgi:hypothetical protein
VLRVRYVSFLRGRGDGVGGMRRPPRARMGGSSARGVVFALLPVRIETLHLTGWWASEASAERACLLLLNL